MVYIYFVQEAFLAQLRFHGDTLVDYPIHYGLKYFPLLNPSQIAPKFNSLVEQCRTKIQIQLEAGYGWEGFHVKICLQKSVETE